MISMAVADDGVFDRRGIEAERAQSADHFVFDRVVEDRVDEDDALGRRDRPDRVLGLPEEVEVVEHLHRLGVPVVARERRLRGGARSGSASGRGSRCQRPARAIEKLRPVVARRLLRVGNVLRRRIGALSVNDRGTEASGETSSSEKSLHGGGFYNLRTTHVVIDRWSWTTVVLIGSISCPPSFRVNSTRS